jgi:hypothetical protein
MKPKPISNPKGKEARRIPHVLATRTVSIHVDCSGALLADGGNPSSGILSDRFSTLNNPKGRG